MFNTLRNYLPVPSGYLSSNTNDDAQQTSTAPPLPTTLELGDYENNLIVLDNIWRGSTEGVMPNLRNAIKREVQNLCISTANMAVVALLTYLASNWIMDKTEGNADETHDGTFDPSQFTSPKGAALLASTLGPAIGQMSQRIINIMSVLISPPRGIEHQARLMRNAMDDVVQKTKDLRNKLPPELKKGFDRTLTALQSKIDTLAKGTGSGQGGNSYAEIENLFKRLNLFLSYPSEMKDVLQLGINGNENLANDIEARQEALVKSYNNPEVEKALDGIIMAARDFSLDPDNTSMPVAYFYGPPGTGKTYCVNELSKILEATVVPMSLISFLAATGESVRGRIPANAIRAPHQLGAPEIETIHSPYKEMIKSPARYGNLVILLDEVTPDELNECAAALKIALLKPLKEYPQLPGMQMQPLHRPMLVVICSNYGPECMEHALLTRIKSKVGFHNWISEGMRDRVTEAVDAEIRGLRSKYRSEVVTPLSNALTDLIPDILDSIANLNTTHPDRVSLRDVKNALEQVVPALARVQARAFNKSQKSVLPKESPQVNKKALKEDIDKLLKNAAELFDKVNRTAEPLDKAPAGNSKEQAPFATKSDIPVMRGVLPMSPMSPNQLRRLSQASPLALPSAVQQMPSKNVQTQTSPEDSGKPYEIYADILTDVANKLSSDVQSSGQPRRNPPRGKRRKFAEFEDDRPGDKDKKKRVT